VTNRARGGRSRSIGRTSPEDAPRERDEEIKFLELGKCKAVGIFSVRQVLRFLLIQVGPANGGSDL
jgi:hypothetical protein